MSLMRAVAQFGQPFNVSVVDRPMPTILNATDAIVRMNSSAICGSDLHYYRASYGSQEEPYWCGHEGIGHVVEVGDSVQFLNVGDYVVVPDNFDDGHFSQEPDTFTAELVADGLQAEYKRVPFADNSLIPVPLTHTSNTTTLIDYLFASDIFATAWSAVSWSGFEAGDSVAVMGAGPVGLLAAYSAILRGASTVYSVDHVQDRLDLAESIGAVPINFVGWDPVEQIMQYEPNGVRRSVEAVGYEAVNSNLTTTPGTTVRNLIRVTAPEGGIGVVGIFNEGTGHIDYGEAWSKKVSVSGGIVLPLQVAGEILPLIESGVASPSFIVSSVIGIEQAPEYFGRFDRTEETKVVIRF